MKSDKYALETNSFRAPNEAKYPLINPNLPSIPSIYPLTRGTLCNASLKIADLPPPPPYNIFYNNHNTINQILKLNKKPKIKKKNKKLTLEREDREIERLSFETIIVLWFWGKWERERGRSEVVVVILGKVYWRDRSSCHIVRSVWMQRYFGVFVDWGSFEVSQCVCDRWLFLDKLAKQDICRYRGI